MNFFKDLKIVELSSVLAGPAVGMFFAEMGAEVIKMENKITNGDVTRTWKNPLEDKSNDSSAYFLAINYGKQSIFLDFNDPKDIEKAHKYILDADIVLTNFPKNTALKFQMTIEKLFELKSNLIIGEISGYGQDDDRVAYDILLQAEAGYLSMTGHSVEEPVKMPVAFIDILAAHQLKEGILIAMLAQKDDNLGKYVSVSLYDTAIASLANQASNFLMTNFIPKPLGTLHPNIAPYGEIFTTSDELKIITAIGSDRQFEAFCIMIEGEEIFRNKNYSTNALRLDHRSDLRSVLQEKIKLYTQEFLIENAAFHKIPISKINNLKQVFDSPMAQKMVLENQIVKSISFEIS